LRPDRKAKANNGDERGERYLIAFHLRLLDFPLWNRLKARRILVEISG
jgi:hypothetical protein